MSFLPKDFDLENVIALSNGVITNYPVQNINFTIRQFVLALYCFYQFVQKQKVFFSRKRLRAEFCSLNVF